MEKKNNMRLIVLVIVLTLSVIGIVGYIVYDKEFKNKINKNNTKITTNKVEEISNGNELSLLLSKQKEFKAIYWDYDYLYKYHFTMEQSENLTCRDNPTACNCYDNYHDTSYNIGSIYDFIKIENSELLWKVDNKWIKDNKLTNVKYLYINVFDGAIVDIVILNNNNDLYRIKFKEDMYYNEETHKYNLTQKIYDSIEYIQISTDKKIDDIAEKGIPYGCDWCTIIYIYMEDKIYVINKDKLTLLEDYFNEHYHTFINEFDNTCSDPLGNIININYDGSLNGIVDTNNKPIYVKYYIQVSNLYEKNINEDNKKIYDLIIDSNKKLYIIDKKNTDIESIKSLKETEIIKDITIEQKGEFYDNITIKLSNNEILEFNRYL